MDEVKISKDHLPILLGHYFREKSNPLPVYSPLYSTDLFHITRELGLTGVTTFASFNKARDSCLSCATEMDNEFPLYGDFRGAFLSAACIAERSWMDAFRRLSETMSSSRARLERPKPLVVAPDTNVLYWRVFSRHLPLIRKTGLDIDEPSYILSQAVVGEIDARIARKYSKKDLDMLSSSSGWKDAHRLQNRGNLRTRMAKLAQNEIHYLRGDRKALECESRKHPGEKEAGDIVIAESYAKFAKNQGVDILLLTGDQDMADHAANQGLGCLLLEVPHELPRRLSPDPWSIQSLLHDVAVLFGAVKLRGSGATVWGEWPGKSTYDYRAERLQVAFEPSAKLAEPFLRDLEICQKMWNG